MTGNKKYYDINGVPRTLSQMVWQDPSWAASRIRDCEEAEERLERVAIERDELRAAIETALKHSLGTWTGVTEMTIVDRAGILALKAALEKAKGE